jgi:hypothetical protein
MIVLDWSEWSGDDYPSMTCTFDGFTATVQLAQVGSENGYNNRQWTVRNRAGVVIGTGYVNTTVNAVMMCEVALYVSGVLDVANKLMAMSLDRHKVREG